MGAVDEPRQHDRASGVVDVRRDPHALERDFEARDVAAPHVHDGIGRACHCACVHDLGDSGEDAAQFLRRDGTPAEQFDVRFGRKTVDCRIDLDREQADVLGQIRQIYGKPLGLAGLGALMWRL